MRLLLLDIETAPNIGHVWGLWQQNIGLNQLIASGYVLCWAAKWLGDKEIHFDSVHQSKPKKMLKRIHKLISEADGVIHYNGKSFDMPTLNKEFILHDMLPPPPYKQVDLCQVAKSTFRFPSNKLEYIAQKLKVTPKVTRRTFVGHSLWTECMAKNPAAWKEMEKYNRGDVITLEGVYNKMLPWIRVHPNHGMYVDTGEPVCTNCGSASLQRRGHSVTATSKYARFQCMSCGTWVRGPNNVAQVKQPIMRRVVT